jgi:hypothetical protein
VVISLVFLAFFVQIDKELGFRLFTTTMASITHEHFQVFLKMKISAESTRWSREFSGHSSQAAFADMAADFLKAMAAFAAEQVVDRVAFEATYEAVRKSFSDYVIKGDYIALFVWPGAPYMPAAVKDI